MPVKLPLSFGERKLAEINLMRSWIGESELSCFTSDTLQEKMRLMRLLASKQRLQAPLVLTNIKREVIQVNHYDYVTDYSRQGGEFLSDQQLAIFYPGISEDLKQWQGKGYFLKNGQSANYITLMILTALGDDVSFNIPARSIYFETDAILFYLQKRSYRPAAEKQGLFIDSGSLTLPVFKPQDLAKFSVIIFDTTCLGTQDTRLHNMLKVLSESGKTVILTRSYIKLDSLGVEFGGLGSLVVLSPEAFELSLPSEIGDPHCPLDKFVRKMTSLVGVHSQPYDIYPFMHDPAFLALNQARVQALRRNMPRVEQAISYALKYHGLTDLSVESYEHQLYCKVRLKRGIAGRFESTFSKFKEACGVPAFNSDSFGFDFMCVCSFKNSLGEEFVRITSFDAEVDDQSLKSFLVMLFFLETEAAS